MSIIEEGKFDELHKQPHADVINRQVDIGVLRSGRKVMVRVKPGEMR
ncbi:hypothetical protein [Puia sp.]